jgi:hypothetical protein
LEAGEAHYAANIKPDEIMSANGGLARRAGNLKSEWLIPKWP